MNRIRIFTGVPLLVALLATFPTAKAQQPQIPTLQVCNLPSVVSGTGTVTIVARQAGGFTGSFTVQVSLECNTSTGYPAGGLTISGISMNDSTIQGTVVATTIDQLTSTGKDANCLPQWPLYCGHFCRAHSRVPLLDHVCGQQ